MRLNLSSSSGPEPVTPAVPTTTVTASKLAATPYRAPSGAGTSSAATEDTTTFSSGADSVDSLTQAALVIPSRADRVASLKQAVSSAQYQLDADKIAESLANADL